MHITIQNENDVSPIIIFMKSSLDAEHFLPLLLRRISNAVLFLEAIKSCNRKIPLDILSILYDEERHNNPNGGNKDMMKIFHLFVTW